jgi:hypothetical protein
VTAPALTRRGVKVKARTDETSINLDPVICEVYRVARTSYRPVSRARIERSFRSPAHRVDIGSRTRLLTCEVSVHRLRETRTLHRMNPDRDFHSFRGSSIDTNDCDLYLFIASVFASTLTPPPVSRYFPGTALARQVD